MITPSITMLCRLMFTLRFKASAIRPTAPTRARRLADASVDPTAARHRTTVPVDLADLVAQTLGELEVAVGPRDDPDGLAGARGDREFVDVHRQQAARLQAFDLEPTAWPSASPHASAEPTWRIPASLPNPPDRKTHDLDTSRGAGKGNRTARENLGLTRDRRDSSQDGRGRSVRNVSAGE